MDETTRETLQGMSERLAVIAHRLGELTLEHERLAERREAAAAPAEREPAGGARLVTEDELEAGLARRDRVDYLETVRGALYRLLFVVDFTLAHDRIDRALLVDARTTLVDGVDAVDACLLLDGVGSDTWVSEE